MPPKSKRLRVLGGLRKSVVPRDKRRQEADPLAFSLEGQANKISEALSAHEIIGFAEDEGVSGDVSPFRRPQLGPWFRRLDDWDALAVARFDRISRSVAHFSDLCEWLREHGKVLICLDPPIDLSTPHGVAFAQMLAVFAQYERALIRLRVSDKWHELRDAGKWMGGRVPFGRMPVDLGREGWALAADPQLQPIVEEMVRRYLAGSSFEVIGDWLNAEKIPTALDAQRLRAGRKSQGLKWTAGAVRQVITSPDLGGFIRQGDGLRRDADGMLLRVDPLITDDDQYRKLQAALKERGMPYRRKNASALHHIAYCLLCGKPMHAAMASEAGHRWDYYVCSDAKTGKCQAARVPAAHLEEMAAERFLGTVGGRHIREPVHVAGVDHARQLEDTEEAIANLEDQYVAGQMYTGPDGAERFARLMSRLEDRRSKLAAIKIIPAWTDYRETEITFRQRWEEVDAHGRRMFMADSGFRLYYARVPVTPGEIGAQARKMGFTRSPAELRKRENNVRGMLRRTANPERAAAYRAELAEIFEEARRRREIPRHREYAFAPTGARLAHRAGLASAGQVAVSESEEEWSALLAPIRRTVVLRPVS